LQKLLIGAAAATLAIGLGQAAMAQPKAMVAVFEDVSPVLNYDGPNSSSPATQMGIVQLMEPLVYYKDLGIQANGARTYDFNNFDGRLAESWTYDAATTTWTFKLRRNVKGCGGTTFNADDVIYSMARAKSSSGATAVATFLANVASIQDFRLGLGGWDAAFRSFQRNNVPQDLIQVPGVTPPQVARLYGQDIKTRQALATATADKVISALNLTGPTANETAQKMIDAAKTTQNEPKRNLSALGDEVKKIDDYTVQIKQDAPNRLLLPVFTIFALLIFDKEGMEKNATADDPWSHTYANNVGVASFGPYCLERWEKDKQMIFTANPDYYRGKADIDRVVVQKQPQGAQRMAVLRAGQAQLTEALTPKEFDSLQNVRGLKVTSVDANASSALWMNWSVKPWDNVDVRKAVAYAIPYDQVLKDVYFGKAKKHNGMFTSFFPGYHEIKEGVYTYDPAKAKEHLAKAGYPGGRGLEQFPVAFQLSYPVERENILLPYATILKTALEDVGFPIKLNPMPMAQFTDREITKKDLEFFLLDFSKSIGLDGGYAVQLLYHSLPAGISNYTRYNNPEVDQIYRTRVKNEVDEAKRNAGLADIQKILYRDVAIAPITETNLQFAHSDKLTGVGFHAEQAVRFYDMRLAR